MAWLTSTVWRGRMPAVVYLPAGVVAQSGNGASAEMRSKRGRRADVGLVLSARRRVIAPSWGSRFAPSLLVLPVVLCAAAPSSAATAVVARTFSLNDTG